MIAIKRTLALLVVVTMTLMAPSRVFADGVRSVNDLCQEVAECQSSEQMTQAIDAVFEALKAEANADETRVKEVTPSPLSDYDEDEDEDDDEDAFSECTITQDGKTMRFFFDVKGDPDESGYPLYIALHGGGEASEAENDAQWYSMYGYYRESVDHGIYVACRGMEDVWNMHSLPEALAMYDRIIEDMVLLKNADSNRVYLLGFSAGGDGVYETTPRMADRFAAANMSSGHPNQVSLLNVANVPFQIQVGVRDYFSKAAKRCVRGAAFEQILGDYHDAYGFGYEHRVLVHVPEGHNFNDNSSGPGAESVVLSDPAAFVTRSVSENWLQEFVDIYDEYYGDDEEDEDDGEDEDEEDEEATFDDAVSDMSYKYVPSAQLDTPEGKVYASFCADLIQRLTGTGDGEYGMQTQTVDTDAVHYVNRFTRNYCPDKVVWDLTTRASGRDVTSFYWLKADKAVDKGLITASFDVQNNAFTLSPSDEVNGDFQVLINPHMVDVARPVTFNTPKGSFTVDVAADAQIVEASLREVSDPFLAWVQAISYQQLISSDESPDETDDPDPEDGSDPEDSQDPDDGENPSTSDDGTQPETSDGADDKGADDKGADDKGADDKGADDKDTEDATAGNGDGESRSDSDAKTGTESKTGASNVGSIPARPASSSSSTSAQVASRQLPATADESRPSLPVATCGVLLIALGATMRWLKFAPCVE